MPHIRPHGKKIQVKIKLQYQGRVRVGGVQWFKAFMLTDHYCTQWRLKQILQRSAVALIAKNKSCNYGTNVTVSQQTRDSRHFLCDGSDSSRSTAQLRRHSSKIQQHEHRVERCSVWQRRNRRNTTVTQYIGGFLNLGVLAQVAPRLQVLLPLHLNGDRVEVVGGEASLGHFSEDRLSVHRLICRRGTSKEIPHGYEWLELANSLRKIIFFHCQE